MNVLITGASSGIGEAICRVLDKEENFLFLLARNEDKLAKAAECMKYAKVKTIAYDLTDLNNIESIFKEIASEGVKLDGLVHSAGLNRDVPIRSNDVEWMLEVMNTNVLSFIEMGKYFSKKKYSSDGAGIVAISSMASLQCAKGMCTYSVSKAGLNAAVKVMAKEFVKRKIRVNAILPNFVDTPMTAEARGYSSTNMEEFQPLGMIKPEKIADLADFLLSEKASYITGALIPVSGGSDC